VSQPQHRGMSNTQLARRIDNSLDMFADVLRDLVYTQKKLEARIAFILPCESDIAREVDDFIESATAP
jgi:hypothetical protein